MMSLFDYMYDVAFIGNTVQKAALGLSWLANLIVVDIL